MCVCVCVCVCVCLYWVSCGFLDLWVHQFSWVSQLCLTLCDPMDCSTPGLPVQLPEFIQTYVHWVGDAIQPSHPLMSPSPPALKLSHHHNFHQIWIKNTIISLNIVSIIPSLSMALISPMLGHLKVCHNSLIFLSLFSVTLSLCV